MNQQRTEAHRPDSQQYEHQHHPVHVELQHARDQRSDATAVPAAGVVAEAMVALVLAEAAVEKFGGDSAEEMRRNAESYLKALVIS